MFSVNVEEWSKAFDKEIYELQQFKTWEVIKTFLLITCHKHRSQIFTTLLV